MVQIKAKYDGKVLIPDKPLDVPAGKVVNLTLIDVHSPKDSELPPLLPAIDPATGKRRLGQQSNANVQMTGDFNDHLGDAFWTGKSSDTDGESG